MSMSELLGSVYGTSAAAQPTVSEEDLQKQANVNFFLGLCEEKGINVEDLDDATTERLWKVAMDLKEAAEGGGEGEGDKGAPPFPPKSDEDKKKEEAEKEANAKIAQSEREWEEKRAAAVKVAEADAMGRIMAHSYVDELQKIASQMDGAPAAQATEQPAANAKEASAQRAEQLISQVEAAQSQATKQASRTQALDELAAYRAIDLLKEAGVNEELAHARINAVYVLGLEDSEKVASAPTHQDAVHIRALEFCERAGFEVNWA